MFAVTHLMMRKSFIISSLIPLFLIYFGHINTAFTACFDAANKIEKNLNLPKGILSAIAYTESGRTMPNGKKLAWPWTVNHLGKGYFFPSKEKAKKFVKNKIDQGSRNIDIGCMQVNLRYHPDAFPDLDTAFDPFDNVKWAGTWLDKLNRRHKSLKTATGYYHSSRKKNRARYSNKVFKNWKVVNKLNNNNDIASTTPLKKENKRKIKNTYTSTPKIESIQSSSIIKVENDILINKNYSDQKTDNLHMANYLPKRDINLEHMAEKNKTNEVNIDSPYLLARMEKISFFRNYFSKYR